MLVSNSEMSPGSAVVVKSMVGMNSRIWFTLSSSPTMILELNESTAETPHRLLEEISVNSQIAQEIPRVIAYRSSIQELLRGASVSWGKACL